MDFVVPLQPTLGARASSPAIFAGEDTRVPRHITTFPAYLLELLPAAEAERSDGAGHCRCAV